MSNEDFDLDRDSQLILLALLEEGTLSTGELRSETDLSQNSQVLYRIDNHLGPDHAGLVENAGERPQRGQNAKLWKLTRKGREWVNKHREDLEIPNSIPEISEMVWEAKKYAKRADSQAASTAQQFRDLEESVQNALEEINETHRYAEEANENAAEARETATKLAKDVARDELRRVQSELQKEFDGIEHDLEQEISSLRKRVDDIEGALGDLDKTLNDNRDTISELQAQVDRVEENYQTLSAEFEMLSDQHQSTAKQADELSRLRDRGFFGRLKWLFFGK